ncbi:MAG TPA: hypothetical protein DEH22_13070 [Chloroflexi bacterium]|nr:hypothetical protein [Chloroflexota bacterium]
MIFIRRIWAFILTSWRSLLARKGTALSALFGLTLAISLVLSITLYADGVYYQTFLENIAKTRENPENQISQEKPTFSFLFHYFGGWHGSKTWDELSKLDDYFVQEGLSSLGIPGIDLVRLFSSDVFMLFPKSDSGSINRLSLSRTSFGTMSALDEHITLVNGRSPNSQPQEDGTPIEVLVNENLANTTGIDIGQEYVAYVNTINDAGQQETRQIPVQVTGIWRANDPGEDYWIFPTNKYESILFVPEETFFYRLTAHIPALIYNAYWYPIMDATYVHADEVDSLLNRITRLERGANEIQENLWLSISPKAALERYASEARLLRVLLYAFSIPVIGLIVAFVSLVTRLITDQRRGEIAILRSRGGTPTQMLNLTALEGLMIGALSLGLSLPIAMQITQTIGHTRNFLDFTASSPLRLGLSAGIWQIGLFCVGVFLVMLLLPTLRASQDTILTYKQTQGRVALAPFWQRAWLDVLLFIPAAYGAYLLRQQGNLSITSGASANPFQNPLLFLVPSLGILAVALFSLRFVGPIMALIEKISNLGTGVGLLMAARHIARAAANYHTPLLILTLTMSLYAYTASLSATLDQAVVDQAYYRVGADARFFDPGVSSTSGGSTWWDFFPVNEYTQSPKIQNAARLGRYAAHISVGRIEADALFLGIDRLGFPQAVFWRYDFSSQNLGSLMNALSTDPANILVNREFLQTGGFKIGESLFTTVKTYDRFNDLTLKIVGTFDYFPTWFPAQGPVIVGNLENLFEAAGGAVPYYVLLQTAQGTDPNQLSATDLRALDGRVRPVDWETAAQYIQEAQNTPERQGLLGFLFLGFATTVLLTVLAFLLHLIFTFQQRSVEFGVLRAAGLSIRQMIANLIWEFTFLIFLGSSIGTGLGILASKVYIPYMQVGAETTELIPPFQVLIPWETITQIYWLFGILIGISLLTSIVMLRRLKIFEAIKLGETV